MREIRAEWCAQSVTVERRGFEIDVTQRQGNKSDSRTTRQTGCQDHAWLTAIGLITLYETVPWSASSHSAHMMVAPSFEVYNKMYNNTLLPDRNWKNSRDRELGKIKTWLLTSACLACGAVVAEPTKV